MLRFGLYLFGRELGEFLLADFEFESVFKKSLVGADEVLRRLTGYLTPRHLRDETLCRLTMELAARSDDHAARRKDKGNEQSG
ncbi:unnamed protein product [marine sediment metagenome]|uniref:Uncharacterized protein n=1 Tax=marine sediment metagenome TaxID=412755 RepID=X1HEY4_9ZZZZ